MASGSDFLPSNHLQYSNTNGFPPNSTSYSVQQNTMSSRSASPQSHASPDSHHSSPASIPVSDPPTPDEVIIEDNTDHSDSDVDAEGSEDDDYAQNSHAPNARQIYVDPPTPSSSSSTNRSSKRKHEFDDADYIKNNPELFGLRRSGRARTDRRLAESSAEDDDSDSDVKPRTKKPRLSTRPPTASKSQSPLTMLSSDESDEFRTNKRHKPSKRQKGQLKAIAAGLAPPSSAHQRFSSRRKAVEVTYNETSDLDEFEDRDWDYVETKEDDDSPYIDMILGFRIKPGRSIKEDGLTKADFVYWVKWQDEAHIHATWYPYDDIKSSKGFRKIQNYWVRTISHYLYYENDESAPLEDKEAFMMKYEQQCDEYEHNQKIDRVINVSEGTNNTQYYVKWQGLQYDGCTWEDGEFVSGLPNGQDKIDAYINRSQRLPQSDRKQAWSSTPVQWRRFFAEQPPYIQGGKLRDFQKLGVAFLCANWCKRDNVIIADEMGLGKTVQTVSFVSWLIHEKKQEGPHLIVVPLSTLPAWMDTFAKWAPDVNAVAYIGSSLSRSICQEHELSINKDPKRPKFNVLVTTYEFIINDAYLASVHWQSLAVDEAHRLKNRESQLYKVLMEYHVPAKLLITGTPMQNSIEELSALLDFLNPGRIEAPENIDDLPPEEGAEILAKFKEAIRPFMLRRTKQEVEKDLPPKTEKILRVECAALQREVYQHIITRNYAALNEGTNGQKQNLLNIMMEMKKCANHPFLFPGIEDRVLQGDTSREGQLRAITTSSGKMMLFDKLLTKLKAEGHRVLVFTQLVSMLNILNDYLQMKGYKFERLDGTVSSSNRRQAIDRYNAPDSEDFCFILSTRAGGLGINLATADTIILFDSDWNPHLDIQAMARAHRIGQTKPVSVYRFVSQDTIEEEILERARNKLVLEFLLIQSGADDEESKKQQRALTSATEAPQTAQDMTEILKRRSQKMFEAVDTQKRLEELDINSVLATAEEHTTQDASAIKSSDGGYDFMQAMITSVRFEGGWDEIIPKEKIEALEAEEQKRKEQDALEKLIEENKPRNRKSVGAGKEQREAKKRARKSAAAMVADSDDDGKDQASDDDSDSNKDPKRPLNGREWRNFIRGCEKYGSFLDEEVQQAIIKESRLTGRDIHVLQAAYEEVAELCKTKLDDHNKQVFEEERALGKAPTKKEKKAVLVEHQGVKRINCETFLERATDMRMVREIVFNQPQVTSYRIPEATKAAHYTCPWGAKEDAMLVVGLSRYGFGGWQGMQADQELGFADKFFLEENRAENKNNRGENETSKSPGAVHLVRRANYLISVLRDKTANGTDSNARKVADNHHRNNKKASRDRVHALKSEGTPVGSPHANGSASPRPRDRPRSSSNVDARASERPDSRASNESSGVRRKHDNDEDERDTKRRRLSDENRAKPNRNGISKAADKDRERDLKRREQRRKERREQLHQGDGHHARDRGQEEERPRQRDDRHRDGDRYSRDRSRSPRRDRDSYRDRTDHRNGHHRDDRRDSRDHYNQDRDRQRDRPYSRDGPSHRHDDRHRDDRRDKHRDSRDHRDDRHKDHRDDRHKDRHHDHRHRDDRDRDRKHHDKPEKKKDSPSAIFFAKNNKELLSSIRAANLNATNKAIDPKERAKPVKKAMAALWNFIEIENNGDTSKPSKEELWKHAQTACWNRHIDLDKIKAQSERSATLLAEETTSTPTATQQSPLVAPVTAN